MASSALPDLQLGSDQLLDFLKAELATIESDLGGPDAEARGLLDMLQRQTRLIQQMSEDGAGGAPAMTDLEIAQQIDSLDAQLSQLEASLSSADKSTMQLLGQSTDRWLNPDHSEHQAGNARAEQPCCSPSAAVEAADEQSGGSNNTGSSGSSQQQAGLGAEQLPTAHGDNTESGRGGGEADEPAAAPDATQQANGSSTEAEVAVAARDAAVIDSNSTAAQQL